MRVQAKARNLDISAQKLRLVADSVRGAGSMQIAFEQLAAQPQKGARMLFDVLHSAAANAEHNYQLKRETLVIEEIRVDQAGKLKRWRPRSRGMTAPIEHPKAHITVIVSTPAEKPSKTAPKSTPRAKKGAK